MLGVFSETERRTLLNYIKFAPLLVIAASLLWSLDGLLRRHLYSLPPSVIVFWEHIFGFVLLLPIIIATFKAFKKLTKKQWLSIGLVSFLSGAVGTIAYTAALGRVNYISFSVVVLLQQLNPIFAIAAAAALLRERLNKRFIILSVIALAAAYVVTFPSLTVNFSTGTGTAVAALFAIGAAASWGVSTAFSRYALKDTSPLHVTAARFGFTPLFALAFVWLSGSSGSLGALTASQWKYIVAITFSTGLVALAIYYYGLKFVLASRAAILELAWPLSAIFVGYYWLSERLTATQLAASAVLLGSIWLIARDKKTLAEAHRTKDKPKLAKAGSAAK
ncbi:hypothetical protein A3F05_01250 [Candidatus Saccharibacteria bacterium RIFCSPHIGHO2_12_FULL_47_17]|nr:MAG: hypothetical protein A3F05_01250 [Candidatus Saccharibacteria bacterium RIFCSPHIGHO2_12_FULL_47_17]